MKIIGLTGSIATGKSTVAQMLREMKLPVFDADACVHKMLRPHGEAVEMIIEQFGADMGSLHIGIDRQKLGDRIFADGRARQKLEQILHPLVEKKRLNFIKQCHRRRQKIAIIDIPLLFETGGEENCSYVITVWAPHRLIKQRALKRKNMNEMKLTQILNTQYPQYVKKRFSDLALPSGLGKGETRKRLKKWLRQKWLRQKWLRRKGRGVKMA